MFFAINVIKLKFRFFLLSVASYFIIYGFLAVAKAFYFQNRAVNSV